MEGPGVISGLSAARQIVVKVGSSSVSGDNVEQIPALIESLSRLKHSGADVVLVSSGAISTGVPFLDMGERPEEYLATQQAAAAVGQNILMNRYQRGLNEHNIVGGQVLLTAGDIENPTHRDNARRAIDRLLDLGILPIVNENDTVATQLRFVLVTMTVLLRSLPA